MRYRCLSCDSRLTTPVGERREPSTPCECGGLFVDRDEYRRMLSWKSRLDRERILKDYKEPIESIEPIEPTDKLKENLSFEQFVRKEAEEFERSDLYQLLNKGFNVVRKKAERALRYSYEFVDAWIVDDYILLFEVKDKDINNVNNLLRNDKINFYVIDNFLVLFLDEKLNYTHRTKLGNLFKEYFGVELDQRYPEKVIQPMVERGIIPLDILSVRSIETNHISLVENEVENGGESYSIKPSKKRLVIV